MTDVKAAVAAKEERLREYLEGYEFRGDTDYQPNDKERLLIEDALRGWVAEEEQFALSHIADQQREVERRDEAIRRLADNAATADARAEAAEAKLAGLVEVVVATILGHKPDASFDDSAAGHVERQALLSNVANEVRQALSSITSTTSVGEEKPTIDATEYARQQGYHAGWRVGFQEGKHALPVQQVGGVEAGDLEKNLGSFWVIERSDLPWGSRRAGVTLYLSKRVGETWTDNIYHAAQFATHEGAEVWWKSREASDPALRIVEHAWIATSAVGSKPQEKR